MFVATIVKDKGDAALDLTGRFSGLLQRSPLIQQQNAVLPSTKGDSYDC